MFQFQSITSLSIKLCLALMATASIPAFAKCEFDDQCMAVAKQSVVQNVQFGEKDVSVMRKKEYFSTPDTWSICTKDVGCMEIESLYYKVEIKNREFWIDGVRIGTFGEVLYGNPQSAKEGNLSMIRLKLDTTTSFRSKLNTPLLSNLLILGSTVKYVKKIKIITPGATLSFCGSSLVENSDTYDKVWLKSWVVGMWGKDEGGRCAF